MSVKEVGVLVCDLRRAVKQTREAGFHATAEAMELVLLELDRDLTLRDSAYEPCPSEGSNRPRLPSSRAAN